MADVELDDDFPRHPLADRFICPKWNRPGVCVCGRGLPPMRVWHNAGSSYQHVQCRRCGMGYVDEDEFVMFYDDGLAADCADSSCWDPRSLAGRCKRARFAVRRVRLRLKRRLRG